MRTRFAPSPTGPLHLGHAYSAILAHDFARDAGGAFLLRIEDIDQSRARPQWERLIYEDLTWLGLTWDGPVMRQSERQAAYNAALDRLWGLGLLYPCTCNRRDIREAANAPQEGAPLIGPDGIVYPGTCRRSISPTEPRPKDAALRLNMRLALDFVKNVQVDVTDKGDLGCTFPTFKELGEPDIGQEILVNSTVFPKDEEHANNDPSSLTERNMNDGAHGLTYREVNIVPEVLTTTIGDVVLARRDMGTSYHLSVVVDDAEQGISHVVRGADLFDATPIHVLLQALLGVPTPAYLHHRLIRDEVGKRLAKRDDARAISVYRDAGETPATIRRLIGLAEGV